MVSGVGWGERCGWYGLRWVVWVRVVWVVRLVWTGGCGRARRVCEEKRSVAPCGSLCSRRLVGFRVGFAHLSISTLCPCSLPSSASGPLCSLHFCPPPRFHICGLGLLRRYQPCAGRSLVFISFLFSTRARQIRTCRAVPCRERAVQSLRSKNGCPGDEESSSGDEWNSTQHRCR